MFVYCFLAWGVKQTEQFVLLLIVDDVVMSDAELVFGRTLSRSQLFFTEGTKWMGIEKLWHSQSRRLKSS